MSGLRNRTGYCCPHCEEAFVDEGELVEHASVCQFDTDVQLQHHGLPLDIAAPLPLARPRIGGTTTYSPNFEPDDLGDYR